MNKIWGFIYNMGDIGKLNQILSGEDCQIIPLSYTSQFGFVFKMTYQNETEILKLCILADVTNIQSEQLGKKRKQKMSIDDKHFELPNYIDIASIGKARDPFDEERGYSKRIESNENFKREAQIQKEVYNTSINNGRLCPAIYGSYIVDYRNAIAVLELLKTKCQQQLEGENMIQYLQNNLNRYELGIIRMEYAEGYTTFREAAKDNTLYENVIYANIRLLLENGYMHLDLNPGNVMVRGDDVLLIDFGKTKDIIEVIQTFDKQNVEDFESIRDIGNKPILTSVDIGNIIDLIVKCEKDYLHESDALNIGNKGLFHTNFVSKLSVSEGSYQNIARKLNERTNKTISPKYRELLTIPSNDSNSISNSSSINSGFGLFGPPSPQSDNRYPLFDPESPDPESPSKRTGLFVNYLNQSSFATPPTTPGGGGAKKSKKTKRKPLHNKRRSKTRKNKSNKKRVKLISNK